jgi:hypothetical protein
MRPNLGIMVNKGNHPKSSEGRLQSMWALIQVSEILRIIYPYKWGIPQNLVRLFHGKSYTKKDDLRVPP